MGLHMNIACPECRAVLKVPDGAAGKRARCPKCGHAFILAAAGSDEAEAVVAAQTEPHGVGANQKDAPRAEGAQWHVLLQNGPTSGPFTTGQLRSMIASGQVDAATQLWTPGRAQWAPANTFQQFASLLASAPPPVSPYPQVAAPGVLPRPARVGLSRVCLACGFQGYMQKKSPTWVIICAILFFPIGLFLLFIKNYKCPQCGTFQD